MTTTRLDIGRLCRLATPPAKPLEAGAAGGWPAVETALGTPLPADYKLFIATYGTGLFDEFLYVFNPFAADPDGNLLRQLDAARRGDAWSRAHFPDQARPALVPAPGGLLPLGRTVNGDQLAWLTGGDPDGWPVVATASRSAEPERHELGLVAFLTLLFEGRLTTGVFPPELGEDGHWFTPG